MSRLSVNDPAVIAEVRAALVDSGMGGSIVSATSALTSADGAVAITFTTDDPSITPDGAVTVAAGDSVTASENLELAIEVNAELAALIADITAIRTAVEAVRSSGTSGVSLADMTATGSVAITYTTGDPSITPNGEVTIADGDLTTAAEMHEGLVEINDQAGDLFGDVQDLHVKMREVLASGLNSSRALATRQSTSGGVTLTYTTDDPSITPGATSVVADGDTLTAAENNDLLAELEDQLDKAGDDMAAIRTTYEALRTLAGA